MAVIQMTSGVPGAGKTYSRVRFLTEDFLINNTGLYITNLPLNVDLIAKDVSKRAGVTKQAIKDRIILVPLEQLREFQQLKNCTTKQAHDYIENGTFPPAVYFEQFSLTNAHIALDEFHLYFSKKTSRAVKDLWNDWIAEIRKNGCTFEAITQDVSQIPSEFMGKVSVRVDLVPLDITRDPFFHIKMYDWYQLRAAFTGQTSQKVCQTETHKAALGKWVISKVDKFAILPEIYQYYHTSTRNDGRKADGEIPPYKRLSKKGLFLWFYRRNFFSITGRFLLACVFIWLCCFGGVNTLMMGFISGMTSIAKANAGKKGAGGVESQKKQPDFKLLSPEELKKLSASEQEAYNRSLELYLLYKKEQNSKEQEKNSFKPVMFFSGKIFLQNGLVIEKDYKFIKGVYDGKTVSKIDYVNRGYYLSDGEYITM
ncbi:MAG: zonular occludens toxin domain-containing protein [Victivallaceae bacterium]|nr:zonular occludens toxin domain-containing protein [Victivallaceae bacterium]